MPRVVLLAGGNLGDVKAALSQAREMIAERVGEICAASEIYHSEAWGFESEDIFLNQAFEVETQLGPEELLDALESIERELGRGGKELYGAKRRGYCSRTMDIDIIFYGDSIIDTPRLTVPHPLMAQRRFVLEPLCSIIPGRVHPVLGVSVKELLERL